jgi:hypothetical protein
MRSSREIEYVLCILWPKGKISRALLCQGVGYLHTINIVQSSGHCHSSWSTKGGSGSAWPRGRLKDDAI